jgi:hypothetical protein
MTEYHIAQLNVGYMIAPLTAPEMEGFANGLQPMNALADATAGFVWRLAGENDNATALRVFDDETLLINMSVWETIDSLYQYAYYSEHAAFFRRRHEWFHKMKTVSFLLWWMPAGVIPTPQHAKDRLAYADAHGITPFAFNFKQRYTPEESLAYAESHQLEFA